MASVSDLTAERVARNNATFRAANEQIEASALAQGMQPKVPFLCECPELTCTEILRLTFDEYEAVRANAIHFINAPGHQAAAPSDRQVVAEHDDYVVVEERGRAGEIAAQTDPRAERPETAAKITSS